MGGRQAPWRCPVCRAPLGLAGDGRRWCCPDGHSFDVAREGYVNLLVAGQRRSRQPGDSPEMVAARRRFLATGAYDPISEATAAAAGETDPAVVVDVGCGEGRHTRHLDAPLVLGVDVAKRAVAAAARAHPSGWYAVASAGDLPLADGAAEVAVDVFGPLVPAELARVVRPGGRVVVVHPGPDHLPGLRALVYDRPRPHEVKPPLRGAEAWFAAERQEDVRFEVAAADAGQLGDLFAMTPYRWHAPPDVGARLAEAAAGGFRTTADVRVSVYRRLG